MRVTVNIKDIYVEILLSITSVCLLLRRKVRIHLYVWKWIWNWNTAKLGIPKLTAFQLCLVFKLPNSECPLQHPPLSVTEAWQQPVDGQWTNMTIGEQQARLLLALILQPTADTVTILWDRCRTNGKKDVWPRESFIWGLWGKKTQPKPTWELVNAAEIQCTTYETRNENLCIYIVHRVMFETCQWGSHEGGAAFRWYCWHYMWQIGRNEKN